jgi:hypothetical protein|tara:strand:- start:3118 stop:3258 length:141 start_codon:yes stop_codon:yes gene_type:complete
VCGVKAGEVKKGLFVRDVVQVEELQAIDSIHFEQGFPVPFDTDLVR